jgi:hypothetical protein
VAYGLEETAIEGWAVECFMCKSKGPFAISPAEAIHRYSPWVAFPHRPPVDGQRITVWDSELQQVDALEYHARVPQAYEKASYTHWAPALLAPDTYLRVTDPVPEVRPPPGENVADARADATLMRDNDFDDDIPF